MPWNARRIAHGSRLAAAGVLLALLAGCGSSGHHTTTTTAPPTTTAVAQTATSPSTSASTTPTTSVTTASTTATQATPSGTGTTTSSPPTTTQPPAPVKPVRKRRFVYVANTVCAQAGTALPRRYATATPNLRRYVGGAIASTQQLEQTLRRVSLATGRSATAAPLVADYAKLLALYQATSTAHGKGVSAATIAAAQHRAVADAAALHIPACAPVLSAHG